MAYQQQFHNRLLRQLNDTNSKNLELQSLLAQKDDEITTLDARLKNALPTSGGEATCSGYCVHQRRNAELITGRNEAEGAAAAADASLKVTTKKFTLLEADLKKQIARLQQDVRQRDELLREVAETCGPQPIGRVSGFGTAGPSASSNAELKKTKVELKRLRSAYSSLQKQFEAEKDCARLQSFPASAPEKVAHLEEADEDDEEIIPNIKHEMLSVSETPLATLPAISTRSAATPFAQAITPAARSTVKRRVQPTPVVYPTSCTPEQAFRTSRSSESRRLSTASQKRARTIGTPKSTIPQKRMSTSKPTPSSRPSKRRAVQGTESSQSNDLNDENNLFSSNIEQINMCQLPRAPGIDIEHLQDKFEFIAVTKHVEDGTIESFHSKEDLKGECDELWEHIRQTYLLWEEARGAEWAWEFEKCGDQFVIPPCVTTQLRSKNGRIQWRAGCEGKYACGRCVEENRPCFTWTGEEFWLLPLHDKDRRWPLEQDNEIRWWLNIK